MKRLHVWASFGLAAECLLGGSTIFLVTSTVNAAAQIHPALVHDFNQRSQRLEFIRSWLVLGPFGSEAGWTNRPGNAGLAEVMQTDYLATIRGEAEVSPQSDAVRIGNRTLYWRGVYAERDRVDLSDGLAVQEPRLGYAWAEILAPRDGSAVLALGSGGSVKLWLNGKLLHERLNPRPFRQDDELIPVHMVKGTNRFLLKIGSRAADWSFSCRFLTQTAIDQFLVSAAMNGREERVSFLLTNGASVKARAGPGLTAWQAAKIRGRTELAERLEKQGADLKRSFPSPGQTLDWLVNQNVATNGPGLAMAVLQDGRVIFERGWGLASLEYGIPITPSTVFHVASVSKQFTAFAITLLAQQGKLSVDDELRKYVPEMHDFGKPITLRHLLYHTSGLRDQWELLSLAGWRLDDVITQKDILNILWRQRELNFPPGEEEMYCNSGYTLLAEVAGRVSEQPFLDFTRNTIFRPLGMTNTHFHLDHEEVVRNLACSYAPRSGGGYARRVLSYANVGATSLFTTVEDLARWIANFENPKVGGPEVRRQMQQKGKLNSGKEIDYGFGLAIGELRQARTISHGGADAGYRSYLIWLPEHHLGVVLLSNLGSMDVEGIARAAAEIFLRDKLAPLVSRNLEAKAKSTHPVDPSLLDRYVGKYSGSSGRVISIVREGDQLKGDISSGSMQLLTPTGEHEFFVAETKGLVVFSKLDSGKAAQYTLQLEGERRVYQRLDAADTVPSTLSDYTGHYRSEELGIGCIVKVKEGQLVLEHRRHGEFVLQVAGRDRFRASDLGSVQFDWDASGKVTGFKLNGGRVRNLRFTRQAPDS